MTRYERRQRAEARRETLREILFWIEIAAVIVGAAVAGLSGLALGAIAVKALGGF